MVNWIRYKKAFPFVMTIIIDFDEGFRKIMILPRRGRRVTAGSMEGCQHLSNLYIKKKRKFLRDICNSGSMRMKLCYQILKTLFHNNFYLLFNSNIVFSFKLFCITIILTKYIVPKMIIYNLLFNLLFIHFLQSSE